MINLPQVQRDAEVYTCEAGTLAQWPKSIPSYPNTKNACSEFLHLKIQIEPTIYWKHIRRKVLENTI